MKFIDKMERKLGRFAIPNLMLYLIILYVIGYVILRTNPFLYYNHLSLDASRILKGEVWRILTYLCYPPSSNIFWLALLSFIYYSIGRSLERVMGAFRFNLYIFLGVLGNVIAALLIYVIGGEVYLLTADKIYLSMLLALSAIFPDMQFYLYFAIPVKAKWLGLVYGGFLIYEIVISGWQGRVAIILSLLNFIVFFVFIRKPVTSRVRQAQRKFEFEEKMRQAAAQQGAQQNAQQSAPKNTPRHRCAVCGITELDAPEMEFRYCSKCEGSYEYCMDHLYTHVHVKKEDPGNG